MKGIVLQEIDKEKFETLFKKVHDIEKKLDELFDDKKSEKISPEEAARELNLTTQTIYLYIKKGIIPAAKTGRKLLIKREDLEAILKEVKSLKYKR
ncbi:helix-turn-helix domain-containing protein [Paucihalobacter ruber]|uniref:Helix-turn-helix domain-containing protein n=1 Tax=Paucihalobacter ruber TaxID=2567861 RepID=A0A506PHE2_9FLAO|nr:helix-turn-helix domain-containing protein [Paucihalobacter ruber]TPV33221.1 helix-turn-helix domain-containing protein [Paucihalobacter ruber]